MEKLEVHNIYIRYLALSPFHFCFHWNLPSQCIPAVSFLPKKAVEFLSLIGPCYITSTDTSKEAVRKGCKKGCRNTHTHTCKSRMIEVGLLSGKSLVAQRFRRKVINKKHYKILKGSWKLVRN